MTTTATITPDLDSDEYLPEYDIDRVANEMAPGYYVGPTENDHGAWLTLPWPGDLTLPYNHPSRLELLPLSLGPAMIRWGEKWLLHPGTGKPWRFTQGQKRFMHLWYAVDWEGRWLYRSGVKRGAKGTGKDPFAAALALCELCGPANLHDIDGKRVIGRKHRLSLVQIGANSQSQAAKVLWVANSMISDRMRLAYAVDDGLTRTMLGDGSKIELLKASEKSTEGDPPTAAFLNESHHMLKSNGGFKIADVSRRNIGKSPKDVGARLLELTNAHSSSAESVAGASYDAWQLQVAGKSRKRDILYDSREAPPGLNLWDHEEVMLGLKAAYSDAHWADLERLRDEAQDERTALSDAVRYYFNGLATAENAWIETRDFRKLSRPDWVMDPTDRFALFLDCSKSGDATTLSASRLSDGHVLSLGAWFPKHGEKVENWLAPRDEVEARIRVVLDTMDIVWFGIDPSPAKDDATETLYWMPMIDQLHRDYRKKLPLWATPGAGGHSVLFDMRLSSTGGAKRNELFTQAAMQTALDIDENKTLTHDGNAILISHTLNARNRPNAWGTSIGKINRSSRLLVDYAVTMIGARMGRRIALNDKKIRASAATKKKAVVLG